MTTPLRVQDPNKYELVINLKSAKAIGTKRTSLVAPHMSAIGGKADMTFCTANVCF